MIIRINLNRFKEKKTILLTILILSSPFLFLLFSNIYKYHLKPYSAPFSLGDIANNFKNIENKWIDIKVKENKIIKNGNGKICFAIRSRSYQGCVDYYNKNYLKLFTEKYTRDEYDIRCPLAENDNTDGCPNEFNEEEGVFKGNPRCLYLKGVIYYDNLIEKTYQSVYLMAKPYCRYYITSDSDIELIYNMDKVFDIVEIDQNCQRRCYFGNLVQGHTIQRNGRYKFPQYIDKFGSKYIAPYCPGALYGFTSDFMQMIKIAYELDLYYKNGLEDVLIGSLLFGLNYHGVHIGVENEFFLHKKT